MAERSELTVTPDQVIAALGDGHDWSAAARELDLPAGLAFMIATGIPADGSGVPELPDVAPAAPRLSSPQGLINGRVHNPVHNDRVDAWVAARAKRELSR